jgi:hypothetical protein
MRSYAEWLDGEYVLLNHVIPGYDHSAAMERLVRFHALLGKPIDLSDVQMIDHKNPIPGLFRDRNFRRFLHETRNFDEPWNFLGLVAEPVGSLKDEKFAVSMKGIERLKNQANRPADSYEEAAWRLFAPILEAGSFDRDRFLKPRQQDHASRVIRRFPQYKHALRGLLHAVDYFSRSSSSVTAMPSTVSSEGYDTLLEKVQDDPKVVNEKQSKRIKKILSKRATLPTDQWGRRAAIRKVLGPGEWQKEEWNRAPENLRLYLDVVHAWNCAISRRIAPKAAALYEGHDDLRLSRYEQTVTDKVGWVRIVQKPSGRLSEHVRRFLSWDPMTVDWERITTIACGTQMTARDLRESLQTGNAEESYEALEAHASEISKHLFDLRIIELPEYLWWFAKAGAEVYDIPSEGVDVVEHLTRTAPYELALVQQRLIINTLVNAGKKYL